MTEMDLFRSLLESSKHPIVFVDTDHIIRYRNKKAEEHYHEWGQIFGKSIFDCHNENSSRIIREIFEEMKTGLEERIITSSPKHRVYMRAVRGPAGELLGYFERYEPALGS